MATSSITHNFVITGTENVERFAQMIGELEKEKELRGDLPHPEDSGVVTDPEELKEIIATLLEKVKNAD